MAVRAGGPARRSITTGRLVGGDFDVDVLVLRADLEQLLDGSRARTLYSLVSALDELSAAYYDAAAPHARAAASDITPELAAAWERHEIELPFSGYSAIDFHRLMLFAADCRDRKAAESGDLAVDGAEVGLAAGEHAVDPALVMLDESDDVRRIPAMVDDSTDLLAVHGHESSPSVDGQVLPTPASVEKTVGDATDAGSGRVGESGGAVPFAPPLDPKTTAE